jgi:hypothetical protein
MEMPFQALGRALQPCTTLGQILPCCAGAGRGGAGPDYGLDCQAADPLRRDSGKVCDRRKAGPPFEAALQRLSKKKKNTLFRQVLDSDSS